MMYDHLGPRAHKSAINDDVIGLGFSEVNPTNRAPRVAAI